MNQFKMFLVYDKKDKAKFIILKASVLFAIIGFAYLAIKKSDITFPTLESKLNFSLGLLGIAFVVGLAFFNRLKSLFRFKSFGFVFIGFILYFLKAVIEPLSLSFLLISIPLIIDDLVITNYFTYLNMNKYFEKYKFVGAHNE